MSQIILSFMLYLYDKSDTRTSNSLVLMLNQNEYFFLVVVTNIFEIISKICWFIVRQQYQHIFNVYLTFLP